MGTFDLWADATRVIRISKELLAARRRLRRWAEVERGIARHLHRQIRELRP